MANLILIASTAQCLEDFGHLADRLREEEHTPVVMTSHDSSASRLQKECSGKQFALVGIMGEPNEIAIGFEALRVIADRCYRTAVGICLDAEGYKFYTRQKYMPDVLRIRCAVLVGEPEAFPHARSIVRIGGKRTLVQNDWSSEELETVANAIADEVGRRIVAA